MAEKTLQVGDCVMLKSGGPTMTVTGVPDWLRKGEPIVCDCAYFQDTEFNGRELVEVRLPMAALKSV